MRATVTLDERLLAKAQDLTGHRDITVLVSEALEALIQREASRRLAQLGGSEPMAQLPWRSRDKK